LELVFTDFVACPVVVTVAGERNGQAGKSAVGSHSERKKKRVIYNSASDSYSPAANSDNHPASF